MANHAIVSEKDLDDGERVTVQLEGREISVFNIDGEYYAYTNWCPHQSGPVCEGKISGTWEATVDEDTLAIEREWTREGKILNCPWHGWEFEIESGESLAQDVRLISHEVQVQDGELVISL